jgi:phage baseplate assembly protein gpV
MNKIAAVVTLSVLAGGLPASSILAADKAKSPKAVASSAATTSSKAKASKPAAHTVSGTLESYDTAGKTLTVKSSRSTLTFDATGAQVWEGSKNVGVEELSSQTGAKVTVKYTEHDGQKAASSIRVAPAHVKTAAKSK